MGLKKAFKSWFLTEVSEAKETVGNLTDKAESALRKREADLKASPEEKLSNIEEEISGESDAFAEARAKIDAKVAEAESVEEMTEKEIKEDARNQVDAAEDEAQRIQVDGEMNEAKAKAALDQAEAAERLEQIRREMGGGD